MNFILKPSLERIALVKVVTLLWNQRDIRDLVTEFSNSSLLESEVTLFVPLIIFREREEKWQKIEGQVIKKMVQIPIPSSLKEKMLGLIQAIGIQIFKWMKFHRKDCCLDLDLPNEFCWTPQGTINKLKTTEVLIREDSIDITTRYKLACYYCLDGGILELWNKIPESQNQFRCSWYDGHPLMAFWTRTIKEENNGLRWQSVCQQELNLAAKSGNKAATEYFLEELYRKEEFLLNAAVNSIKKPDSSHCELETVSVKGNYNEVLYFLMSQMNSDQQLTLFQQYPHKVLCCLLDWPFQSLFVKAVNFLWNFLPKSHYFLVLFKIIEKEFNGYKYYNYKEAFWYVWQQIPDADKSSIINGHFTAFLLDILLHIKDKESIKVIFQGASRIEKHKFIFSQKYLCKNMIHREEWDLVKFFVQLLISSKNEMIKFKQEMQEEFHIKHRLNPINLKVKICWDEFFQILDDIIRGYDESENSSAKRLCHVKFEDVTQSAEE